MNTASRLILVLACSAVLAASPLAAQTQKSLPQGVTQDMIVAGNTVYHGPGLCYACHGPTAQGLVGPSLVDTVWIHIKGSYPEIVTQVLGGVTKEASTTGVPMPPRGGASINDEQVRAVSAYVWSLSHPVVPAAK